MVTTFSNPKEMLGYKIIQDMSNAPDILKAAPYERKAAYAYYYVLRHIHSQMVSFHSDMFVLEIDEATGEVVKYKHAEAYPVIMKNVKDHWATVYSNQQDLLLETLFKFSELIASSFPKLGLVPESGESIQEEERVVDVAKEDQEAPNELIQTKSTYENAKQAELERLEAEIAKLRTKPVDSDDSIESNEYVDVESDLEDKGGSRVNIPAQPPVRKPTGYRIS